MFLFNFEAAVSPTLQRLQPSDSVQRQSMYSFSREAADSYAQRQIKQKRIERLKAVRAQAARRSKHQSSIYKGIVAATDVEMKEVMADEWSLGKSKQMEALRAQYYAMQKAKGMAHQAAHESTAQNYQTAIQNERQWEKQQLIQSERARTATSVLQKKLLDEEKAQETRAQWRRRALKMAEEYRQKLQRQLEHQYFMFRPFSIWIIFHFRTSSVLSPYHIPWINSMDFGMISPTKFATGSVPTKPFQSPREFQY